VIYPFSTKRNVAAATSSVRQNLPTGIIDIRYYQSEGEGYTSCIFADSNIFVPSTNAGAVP